MIEIRNVRDMRLRFIWPATALLLASMQKRGHEQSSQNYERQQQRGLARKIRYLDAAGSRCNGCGYHRNLAALTWHHVDPSQKLFSLDIRAMSNRSESELRKEITKCIVLCANCHAELHFPQLMRALHPSRICLTSLF